MKLDYPSHEFDSAVAAVCHGLASDDQIRGLNELLRRDPAARDEYILRLELHSRLASHPSLYERENENPILPLPSLPSRESSTAGLQKPSVLRIPTRLVFGIAAGFALLTIGWWQMRLSNSGERKGTPIAAVAMLNRVSEVEWSPTQKPPRPGAPLEAGWLRMNSGLAQIVFYSGARVVVEGPAELQLVSPGEILCARGRIVAEVPPQAKGFRVRTQPMNVVDLGTIFGINVHSNQTELHVFKGSVEYQISSTSTNRPRSLHETEGVVVEPSGRARSIPANRAGFASLFDLQNRSSDTAVLQHEQWRAANSRLDRDSSLLIHFDFESGGPPDWRLPNASQRRDAATDATVIGCEWTQGRWPDKRALEFRGVSDRIRLDIAGEYESLTFVAWVRVQGLDRQINSLFMSDGFDVGTVHWSIRDDGVMALTAIGPRPGDFQILTTPPVVTLEELGLWLHLAVSIDGLGQRVIQYVNGSQVSNKPLKNSQRFRLGVAEIGNWNARGFPSDDPFHIRNFSGAMDEFCIFSRALTVDEIRALHTSGKPQPSPSVSTQR